MGIVTVLVCTRHRPESLLRTVRSLLRSDAPSFELIVLDQSDTKESERALDAFSTDTRLRYVRSQSRGKGAALNEGLGLASGDIVVCTDDDCEAAPDWIRAMTRVVESQPPAAIVFCNVTAPAYDPTSGYVPAYERPSDRRLSSLADVRGGIGLGAGMALRRGAILSLGGFDETFGPGSRFGSGDDWDLTVRALIAGLQVYDASNVSILHHGFRTLADGRSHALRDWIAIGALCAKPIRAGHFGAVTLALRLFSAQALWPPIREVLQLKRPSGLSRIVGFIRGFMAGLRTPLDRKTLVFRPRID